MKEIITMVIVLEVERDNVELHEVEHAVSNLIKDNSLHGEMSKGTLKARIIEVKNAKKLQK